MCHSFFLIKLQAMPPENIRKPLTQMFSWEFCEIFQNILFTENLWVTACFWGFISLLKKKKKIVARSNFMWSLQEVFLLIIFTDIWTHMKKDRFNIKYVKLSIRNIQRGRGFFKQRLQIIEDSVKFFACFYVQKFCRFSRKTVFSRQNFRKNCLVWSFSLLQ